MSETLEVDKIEKVELYATWHGFDLKLTVDGYLIVNDKYKVHISETEASDEYPFESETEVRERIIDLLFSGVQFTITVNIYETTIFWERVSINVCNDAFDIFNLDVPKISVVDCDDH